MLQEPQVSDIFKALADTNRLQLFTLLLASDHTNSELMNKTQLSQNLLSHHLNVLVQCDLIAIHQSIGDARRHYYSVNLATTRRFGEWWQQRAVPAASPLPALDWPRHVLFLCMKNGFRSLVAEALVNHLASQALVATSAGLEPVHTMPALVTDILAHYHIPADGLRPQTIHDLDPHAPLDMIVTVCDLAHERATLPDWLQAVPDYRHWSVCDPKLCADKPAEENPLAHDIYAEIVERLSFLVGQLAAAETG